MNIGRERKAAGDPARRVVISQHAEHGNAGLTQSAHLPYEEQSRNEVLPVSVVQVARQNDESNSLTNRILNQILKRSSTSAAGLFNGRALITLKPSQGAIEVDIGGVKKSERPTGVLRIEIALPRAL